MNNWRMILMNELMELILTPDLSTETNGKTIARLNELYNGLTEAGREHIDIWAEDNDRGAFKMYIQESF